MAFLRLETSSGGRVMRGTATMARLVTSFMESGNRRKLLLIICSRFYLGCVLELVLLRWLLIQCLFQCLVGRFWVILAIE